MIAIVFFYLFFTSCCGRYNFEDDYVSFYIGLKPNQSGVDYLKKYILEEMSNVSSKNYGHFLTINEIHDLLLPPNCDINLAIDWFTENNATKVEDYGDIFFVEMPTPQFMKSFNVQIAVSREFNSKSVTRVFDPTFGNDPIYEIPDALKNIVSVIELQFGTSLKSKLKHASRASTPTKSASTPTTSTTRFFIPSEVLLRMYNIDNDIVQKNISVGAVEFEGHNGFNQLFMMKTQNASGVKPNPVAPNHILGVNRNIPDDESELDMSVIWTAASNAELWYVDYPGWIFGWANYMFVRKHVPQVVSLSWGWNEDDQCSIILCPKNVSSKTYVEYTNIALMKLVARGMTIVVSSGDAGSPGRTNELCDKYEKYINPIFPGGSPWVLSVGATYTEYGNWKSPLCENPDICPNLTREGVTSFNVTGWTSGSGFTQWDETPIWQKKFVEKYLNSGVQLPDDKYFNRNGRAYPDVTINGHHCVVYDPYAGWIGMDGTSCSAPIMAGIIANINSHQQKNGRPFVGFVNPLLYKLYEHNPFIFNDISDGNSACTEQMCCNDQNFGFLPVKGIWDVVSGFGSPNVRNIIQELDKL